MTDTTRPQHETLLNSTVPLLKWPGGKRALLKHLLPLIPRNYNRYFEPFFGGGAFFFALSPRNAILSDINPDLINCYVQVRDNAAKVIECLSGYENSETAYYSIRNQVPTDHITRAARLIYLARFSFNGIYRINLRGYFNVPYGHKTHLDPCDPDRILAASAALQNTTLSACDFSSALDSASKGDLVYLDPPYTVAHGSNGFLKYNARMFSWKDQERLANYAKNLSDKGCSVIISNADHPSITDLYQEFRIMRVSRPSLMAASGAFRRTVSECIFFNEVTGEC
jgi:DNA adenine methylase